MSPPADAARHTRRRWVVLLKAAGGAAVLAYAAAWLFRPDRRSDRSAAGARPGLPAGPVARGGAVRRPESLGAAATEADAAAGPRPELAPEASPTTARAARRRLAIVLLTALMGAAVLLWGADRLARVAAETLLADELQRMTGVLVQPEVEVHGSLFLLQALRGRYERVDVGLRGLSAGPVRIETLEAELSDVYVPLGDLLLRSTDRIVVGQAEETALLTYDDLNRYLDFTGRPFTVEPAGGREVTITGEVQVFGRDYSPSVDARLAAEGGALAVSPTRVETGPDLDRAAELLLRQRFTFRVPLDPLPFGQQVTGISAETEGIVVDAAGGDVVLLPR